MTPENPTPPSLLRSLIDAMPSMVFAVDDRLQIREYNAAAAESLATQRSEIVARPSGDALHCIHATDRPAGCGHGPYCQDCVIRNSLTQVFRAGTAVRRRARLEVARQGRKVEIYALISASRFDYRGESLALLVIDDLSEIAELYRMIPICSVCKRVRDETESWSRIEAYFRDHWALDFTHSLCPECYEKEKAKIRQFTRPQGRP